MFFVVIFVIVAGDLIWWAWAHGAAGRLPRAKVCRRIIATFALAQLGYIVFFILAPIVARRPNVWTPMPIVIAIYLWHLLVMPATIVLFVLTWLARKVISLSRYSGRGQGEGLSVADAQDSHSRKNPHPNPLPEYRERELREHREKEKQGTSLSRRAFLAATAITVPPLVTVAVTGRAVQQLSSLRVRRIDVPIANLPPPLDGLTIAHVSDTHIGRFTRPGTLPNIIETTNQLRADLVIFTGDLIDMSLADLPAGIDFLKKLDPRLGMMMIEGNHDLFIDPLGFEQRVRAANLPLLLDDARTLSVRGHPIQFLGIRWGRRDDWPRRHSSGAVIRASVQRVLALRDPNAFSILLAHHPHAFDSGVAARIPLTLSGHTHGGQLMLNERLGAGPLMFKYWSGLYRKQNSSLVVSNGTGNWFPLRINAPAEIVHLTLRSTET